MKVLVNDPPRARREGGNNFVDLPVVLREADMITFHVPLNMSGSDKTWHLFNMGVSGVMKKGVWVFNTSRGEVTDTDTLKNIIRSGLAGGVVLDVWENEPCIDTSLMEEVFLATPHIAGYSADGKANGTSIIVNALCDYFSMTLRKWYPSVPSPPEPLIRIDTTGKKDEEIIREAVMHTYNVGKDDMI
jgi:erythronate-4-phosphate dehydrogenase